MSKGSEKDALPTIDNIKSDRREFLELTTLTMGHFKGASETMDSIGAMLSVKGSGDALCIRFLLYL